MGIAECKAVWESVAKVAQLHAQKHHANFTAPQEALDRIRELELPGWQIKTNATHVDVLDVTRLLAKGDASLALTVAMNELVVRLGMLLMPTSLGQAILKRAPNSLFCAAVSERDTYSNDINSAEPGLPATPTPDGQEFVLGIDPYRKWFCTGITTADYVLVSCRDTVTGQAMFALVPTDAEGLTIEEGSWRPLGARATLSEGITFNGVRVPKDMTVVVDPFVQNFLAMAIVAFGYYTAVSAQVLLGVLQMAKKTGRGEVQLIDAYLERANETMQLLMHAAQLHDDTGPAGPTKTAIATLLEAKRTIGLLAEEVYTHLWPYIGLHTQVMFQAPDATGDDIKLLRDLCDLMVASKMPPHYRECERLLEARDSLPGRPG